MQADANAKAVIQGVQKASGDAAVSDTPCTEIIVCQVLTVSAEEVIFE